MRLAIGLMLAMWLARPAERRNSGRERATTRAFPPSSRWLGHDFGDEISSPDQIVAYLRALAAAAPERTRLVEYARTWEGRPLHTLVIASPERIARLDAVKADLRRLADPRTLAGGDADRLLRELPVVTWLIHAVHGNEISSSDAALAEAYHLLAAQGDAAVDTILRESIVLIDPLENPDGRARFLAQNLLGRAATPDPEPAVRRARRALAGRPREPLPVRHEPRLVRAVAAGDARPPGSRSTGSRTSWSTSTRWAASRRTTSRRRPTREPAHHRRQTAGSTPSARRTPSASTSAASRTSSRRSTTPSTRATARAGRSSRARSG